MEQHVNDHQHDLMFPRTTVADFILRKRREKDILRRFEGVQDKIRSEDPELYEELTDLKKKHEDYEANWGRIKYHPDVFKKFSVEKDIPVEEDADDVAQESEDITFKELVADEEREATPVPVEDDKEIIQLTQSMSSIRTTIEETKSVAEELADVDDSLSDILTKTFSMSEFEAECRTLDYMKNGEVAEDIEELVVPPNNPLTNNHRLKYKPRLNAVWQKRLEASQKEREERIRDAEAAKEAKEEESKKAAAKETPQKKHKKKSQTSICSRLYRSRPLQSKVTPVNIPGSSEDLSLISPQMNSYRRDSLPPPYTSVPQLDEDNSKGLSDKVRLLHMQIYQSMQNLYNHNHDLNNLGLDCKIEPRGNRSSELRYIKSSALKVTTDKSNPLDIIPHNGRQNISGSNYSHNILSSLPMQRSNSLNFVNKKYLHGNTASGHPLGKEHIATAPLTPLLKPTLTYNTLGFNKHHRKDSLSFQRRLLTPADAIPKRSLSQKTTKSYGDPALVKKLHSPSSRRSPFRSISRVSKKDYRLFDWNDDELVHPIRM